VQLLESKGMNTEKVWSSIATHEGSVLQLDCLTQEEKDVFKTAQEIDQRWLIELAADRAPFVCQGQSLNVFLPGNVSKQHLHDVHFAAWKKGVKGMYYARSTSLQRAEKVGHKVVGQALANDLTVKTDNNYEECLSCQ
jgi:ribonucleoside-diphosphate reductase alpha chain